MDRRSKVQYNAEEAIYSILDLGSDQWRIQGKSKYIIAAQF